MKIDAIVYTSNTGHTRQYAQMLGDRIHLPAYDLETALTQLARGSRIVYLGWIHASHVKGYEKAAKRFQICAVCGVGLCDTGTLTDEVRKATRIPDAIPIFTLQGGLDRSRLTGMNKLLISMLAKGLAAQKQRSAQDERMLELLNRDASYVSADHLKAMLDWFQTQA